MEKIDFENDSRFNILNVAEKNNIKIVSKAKNGGDRYIGICPFCDDTTGHLYLTIRDHRYYNVFKCVKCGETGSAISLHSRLRNLTNKEAFSDLLNKDSSSELVHFAKKEEKQNKLIIQNKSAPVEVLNNTYSKFLDKLILLKKHGNDLLKRGLSRKDISNGRYKSLPSNRADRISICEELIKEGCVLKGVPGFFINPLGSKNISKYPYMEKVLNLLFMFLIKEKSSYSVLLKTFARHFYLLKDTKYKEKSLMIVQHIKSNPYISYMDNLKIKRVKVFSNIEIKDDSFIFEFHKEFLNILEFKWDFCSVDGYLIPILNKDSLIQGFQIRRDKSYKNKYIWFSSSGYNNGTKSKVCIHIAWNKNKSIKKIGITEGPLKANIASKYSNITYLAVPGVNVGQEELINLLEHHIKSNNIGVCFDMDILDKKEVKRALENLIDRLKRLGSRTRIKQKRNINFKVCTWNKKYKGIDDYFYELYLEKYKKVDKC